MHQSPIQCEQIVFKKTGDASVLELQTAGLPLPNTNEVTIKVGAAGINFADILARQGLYQDAPPLPSVVGYEVAGTIVAQGNGKTDMIGKRVFALTRFGGYSSYVNVPVEQTFATPEHVTDIQMASVPVAYFTAYQLVVAMGGLKKHETILIHNAGGAVGLAALNFAKRIGATTIGTASAKKHAFLQQKGFDHLIDYTKGDWLPQVMDITKGKGAQLIIDPLGGESFKKSLKALRKTGRLGMFGVSNASDNSVFGKLKLLKTALSMPLFSLHPVNLMMQNKSVFGVNLGHMWDEVETINIWAEEIINGINDGWITPHVHAHFSFAEVAQAQACIENRKNMGKVVLVPEHSS